ncbi:hypothetical protein Tco_1082892 [Tanacetum coccineum]|uniref:Uncharacterized protein n=1 Tax=Tanacetum coccineum TaxID=301880 RepID=A0ABQ5I3C2_9ASTR
MQTTEEKDDLSTTMDASLVDTESSETESKEQDTRSRSGNDAHADDADLRPIYNEEPMAENAEQCHDTCPLPAKLTDNQTTELSNQSLEFENIETINLELEHKWQKLLKELETLKRHYKELFDSIKTMRTKTIEHTTSLLAQNAEFKAQLQEKGFAIAALKNELRKLTGNSVNTKFAKSSILGKPVLPTTIETNHFFTTTDPPPALKSERPRISKPRFASQVDVYNDLSKPVTTHYLPKERESAVVKPHHVIASRESRNSSKNMPRFSSNDMVHNHYLEDQRQDTRRRVGNSKPSVMPPARSQPTANGIKPKPRSNTQTSRNWLASKNRVEGKMDIESVSNQTKFITTAARPYGSTTTKAQNQDGCLVTGQKCPVEKVLNGTEASKVRAFASQIAGYGVDPRKQTFSFCPLPVVGSLALTKASASKFLLSWLYQHEHEYENTGPNISRKERMLNNKRSCGLKAGLMIERDGD